MTPDPVDGNRSVAPHGRVCDRCGVVHDPDRCQKHSKRSGKQCRRRPHPGSDACVMHGAGAPQVQAVARRRLALGQAEVEVQAERDRRVKLGGVLPVDNAEALASLVEEAAFNVAVYRHLVQQLEAGRIDPLDDDEDGYPAVGLGSTLAVKTGSSTKTNEAAPHVWLTLYDEERDRLARWSKMAIDAGISERRVQLVEDQARMVATAMRLLVELLGPAALDLVGSPADRARLADLFASGWPPFARQALKAITIEGEAA